ncbi:probable cytochrome P450 303a1 [Diprion similis]|uniref:probable cytochrome P450 303a1 n=1 Tax=Diprion similis TaxID=362088 RepID=UPI001EF76645|nr:probable cytochrome P450 303a1 [Diprion similis]
MFLQTISITILAFLYFYLGLRKPKAFPPGPKWWPIIGSALEVSRIRKATGCLYKACMVLSNKYGPIFGIKIGGDRIVVLNDYETIHSMLNNEDCDGRPNGVFYRARTRGQRQGILVTDGPFWIEQRRFLIRHLREFGFGRDTMTSLIEAEAVHLVEHLKKLSRAKNQDLTPSPKPRNDCCRSRINNGQIYQLASNGANDEKKKNHPDSKDSDHGSNDACTNPKSTLKIEDMYVKPEDYDEVRKLSESGEMIVSMNEVFGVPVLNTLWEMIAGKRYSNEDTKLLYLQRLLNSLLKDVDMTGCLFGYFPILRILAPKMSGYKQFLDVHQHIWDFLNEELENHKTTFDPSQVRDLMDAYINVRLRSSNGESYSESQLLATCLDLFIAGSETTSKALETCFLYLVLCPEVQEKAQREIDAIVGNDRLPTLADRPRMPYVDAIVLESLRMFMGRTMNIPHRALKDTVITGYRIPKDTMIVVNFNGILMDEFWKDPEIFRPERFINDAGTITIPSRFLPFSYGKHRCIGEVLAKSNIFLLTATLLQTFTFSVVPGETKPTIEFIDGVTISPKPYRALVNLRFKK